MKIKTLTDKISDKYLINTILEISPVWRELKQKEELHPHKELPLYSLWMNKNHRRTLYIGANMFYCVNDLYKYMNIIDKHFPVFFAEFHRIRLTKKVLEKIYKHGKLFSMYEN